ncbi:DinB family protein [Gluconobacter japonicus]|uniref:DinB family protein n=1 Tax=Gluconobacter japonicus TaxID=376620 RepID=UPI0039ED0BE1
MSGRPFPDHLRTTGMLLQYRVWADRLTYEALLQLPHEEIVKPRQTTFGTILQTLGHVYVVDDMFHHHLQGTEHGYRSRQADQILDLEEWWHATQALHQWYMKECADWSVEDLKEQIAFAFIDGQTGIMTREEIILHVINHASYHRGFIGDMLKQIPYSWPANDLTVFLRNHYDRGV